MIVGIVCHVEVLKLNHEAIVWQIILPDYYLYATKLIFGGLIYGHPWRPRVSQLGREKRRGKSFQACLKSSAAPFLPSRLTAPGSPRMIYGGKFAPPPPTIILTGTFSGHVLHATLLFNVSISVR